MSRQEEKGDWRLKLGGPGPGDKTFTFVMWILAAVGLFAIVGVILAAVGIAHLIPG